MFNQADYYAFKRTSHSLSELEQVGQWDYFLSSYDGTERVLAPFERIQAAHKQWLLHEEYGFEPQSAPTGAITISSSFDPPAMVTFVRRNAGAIAGKRVCVDSTGFIRPHLLVLMWALQDIGLRTFDVLYSDPVRYAADEHTEFSGPVTKVMQVPGYQGTHRPLATDDVLIIGAGYDYEQIIRACEEKRTSTKYILTGLPSLQPHMYQESVLQIERAREWIGSLPPQQMLYASANNIFSVAQILHEVVTKENEQTNPDINLRRNIYFCPVGPKPHVLGFGLYYLRHLRDKSASIVYPFSESYERLTTDGITRTWLFRIELL